MEYYINYSYSTSKITRNPQSLWRLSGAWSPREAERQNRPPRSQLVAMADCASQRNERPALLRDLAAFRVSFDGYGAVFSFSIRS